MKRDLMIALAVIVVMIMVITGVGILSTVNQKEHDDTKNPLKIGYFLTYNRTGNHGGEVIYEIEAINGMYIDIKRTGPFGISNSTTSYSDSYFSLELQSSSDWTCIFIGNETIETKWGAISTELYQMKCRFSSPSVDYWIYNGVLIKTIYQANAYAYEMTLVDTNMPQLTSLINVPQSGNEIDWYSTSVLNPLIDHCLYITTSDLKTTHSSTLNTDF